MENETTGVVTVGTQSSGDQEPTSESAKVKVHLITDDLYQALIGQAVEINNLRARIEALEGKIP